MRTCVLCDNTIRPQYRLCYTCYKEYAQQMNEPWFKELELMQKKQDRIDIRESSILSAGNVDMYGQAEHAVVTAIRSVGRPATSWILVNEVLRLYDESIEQERAGTGKRYSLRKLEKAMNSRVKFLTIRRILLSYRSDTFPKKELLS